MKDQHERITGYRDLTQEEIDLVNEAMELEKQLGALWDRIDKEPVGAGRSAAVAKTYLQTGFMWLVRAIARPET